MCTLDRLTLRVTLDRPVLGLTLNGLPLRLTLNRLTFRLTDSHFTGWHKAPSSLTPRSVGSTPASGHRPPAFALTAGCV